MAMGLKSDNQLDQELGNFDVNVNLKHLTCIVKTYPSVECGTSQAGILNS